MRPFFSYYGSKFTGAKHYGRPRGDIVIEPFAGSACYSLYWNCKNVKLYDKSSDICILWDFLINCSEKDIQNIPTTFEDVTCIEKLNNEEKLLVGFWISKGRSEPAKYPSPWYFSHMIEAEKQCKVWGAAVKKRIIKQKPMIKKWEIENCSYDKIPNALMKDNSIHWHIDPPYNNKAGGRYPESSLDYRKLANWCNNIDGSFDVCENVGADWLDFEPLYEVVSSRGRRTGYKSKEAVFRKL